MPGQNSTSGTPRVKETLFNRLRRKVVESRTRKTTESDLGAPRHLSRSTGTLVRGDDFDDLHSINTSTLDSENESPYSPPVVVQPQRQTYVYHNRSESEDIARNKKEKRHKTTCTRPDSRVDENRKRMIELLSTQGVALLQSLDTAMKRVEGQNHTLKLENRKLAEELRQISVLYEESVQGQQHSRQNNQAGEVMQLQQLINKNAELLEEKIEQSSSINVTKLVAQNGELTKELATAAKDKKMMLEELASLKRSLHNTDNRCQEQEFLLQNKLSELQREKDAKERQLQRDLNQAKDECSRLTGELNKANALINEGRNENRQLTAKYEALVLQQAELTRDLKAQTSSYQELQKRVSDMAEDQLTNDSILQATIQMAKKAEKERKRIHGVAENTGKLYETYFAEYESDAQSLRAKLKTTRATMLRNKKVYEKLLMDERSKNVDRLRAKDEELSYLRALLGTRDADMSKAYGRYSAASELLSMSLLMHQPSKAATAYDAAV